MARALLLADNASDLAVTALELRGDEERICAGACDGYLPRPMRYRGFLAAASSQLEAF